MPTIQAVSGDKEICFPCHGGAQNRLVLCRKPSAGTRSHALVISIVAQRVSNPGKHSVFFAERFLFASSTTPGWAIRSAWTCKRSKSNRIGLPVCDPEKRRFASTKTFTRKRSTTLWIFGNSIFKKRQSTKPAPNDYLLEMARRCRPFLKKASYHSGRRRDCSPILFDLITLHMLSISLEDVASEVPGIY